MAATANARTKSTIHVSSLAPEVTKDVLQAAFIPFGEIVDIQIPMNDEGIEFLDEANGDHTPKGFAYIEFEDADDAAEAIFNMHESELYNRVIKVDVAKPHRGLAGLDSTLPGISLRSILLMIVWQQEEWIKANVMKDGEGEGEVKPDLMQGLELAQHQP